MGYVNSKIEERGQKTIFRDPERFDAVRRMWDIMLTGNASPARIQKIANDEWGFRTRQTKRTGGKPLSRSTVYKIFSDTFYYGQFEYPKGSGRWYQGKHEPMITEAEFACVQKMLHRETNPRPQTEFPLPYRGLIKCGECGSSITAHFKEQVRCPTCHYKSSVKNRDSCAKCGLLLRDMKAAKIRRYGYYHCTRSLNAGCRQKCVSSKSLEEQVTEKLKSFGLPPELRDWGFAYIEKLQNLNIDEKRTILEEKKKAFDQCVIRLENLVKLMTAPENADNSLISDEEYHKQRADLLAQKGKLATDASTFETVLKEKGRITKEALNVVGAIQDRAVEGDALRKREILSALGLNHVLKEKELEIRPEFPFCDLPHGGKPDRCIVNPIEPDSMQGAQAPNGGFGFHCPRPEREPDEDRTKRLQFALDKIWKRLDAWSPIFNRFPFSPDQPMIPGRRRQRGRFVSEKTSD